MNPQTSIDERLDGIVRELISAGITREQAMEAVERKLLITALDLTHGNVTQASKRLGVHRNTFINRRRLLLGDSPETLRRRELNERRDRKRGRR